MGSIVKGKFGFGEGTETCRGRIMFYEKLPESGIERDIRLKVCGEYELEVVNEAAFENANQNVDLSEEITKLMLGAVNFSLMNMRTVCTDVKKLPVHTTDMAKVVKQFLDPFILGYGLQMGKIIFTLIKRLEEDEKKDNAKMAEPKMAAQTTWKCSYCDSMNSGKFCTNCGAPRS